jgi:hypothetical protein
MQPTRKLLPFLLALPLLAQPSGTGLKLPAIPARDASILADADSRTYYLYASPETPAGEVVAYKSKDLLTWEGPASVFQVPSENWAKPADGVRDPRVFAYRGKYYLFATLSNSDGGIAKPPASWRVTTARGTEVFVAESPQGPFRAVPNAANKPYTPSDFVALGGSLYIEGDLAWLVYVHDWTQVIDSTIDALRLKADLSAPVEDPVYLFEASDAPWFQEQKAASREPRYYRAGGPFVYRTRTGSLILIWSGQRNGKSAVTVARSVTGKVRGPWKQGATLLSDDSAQPTVFKTFDGRLMMAVHQPAAAGGAMMKLVELEDVGDTVRLKPAAAR